MVVLPAPPFWLRRLMPAYARLAMYDDAGRQYFVIGGELRPARVRDDVYLHIEAGTAPTCPDCAATGAAMKMRRCTTPPGAFACDFCTTVFAPLFVAQADGTVGRPRVQLRAEVQPTG